ncbi:Txe/YoeB family addiction module toxin [Candidatus Sumerlaeota bacterium]|nr:Txe/YoeB family addiction module toxin [Candidatus Sumerlaeota bacterium]
MTVASTSTGYCRPEPPRHDLKGFRSRRIDDEHRFVYAIEKDRILIAQARHHY